MELIAVDSPLMNRFKESLTIDVNGKALSELPGVRLAGGETLKITAALETEGNVLNNYTCLELTPELAYKTEDGSIHTERLLSIIEYFDSYQPEQFLDLVKYLKARWAI